MPPAVVGKIKAVADQRARVLPCFRSEGLDVVGRGRHATVSGERAAAEPEGRAGRAPRRCGTVCGPPGAQHAAGR